MFKRINKKLDKYNIKIYNYSKMVRKNKISDNKTKALVENNKRLYESIMREVAKTVKKHLNENNSFNKQFIYVYVHFDSENSENCYTNPNKDINHSQIAKRIKDIIIKNIYKDNDGDFENLDENDLTYLNEIHEGYESQLEVGYEWKNTDNFFIEFPSLVEDIEKFLDNEKVFIEYLGDEYFTN